MKLRLVVCLFITACCFSNVRAQSGAQAHSLGKENLQGMKAIYIAVEDINSDIGTTNLTTKQIETDVQLKLQKAGIRTATEDEWINNENIGSLNLNINLLRPPDKLAGVDNLSRLIVYTIQLNIYDIIRQKREPSKHTLAATYMVTSQMGIIGTNELGRLRSTIGNSVDAFVKDYLAMNPK